jgi:hypothetical protein
MRIVIFGESGMVGQGALRERLRDPEVEQVVSIVRAPSGATHQKLREIGHKNFLDFTPVENELAGLNACLYCLGVTSTGTTEETYTRITYEFTIAAATTLLKLNPGMSFVFVSGAGADSTERGSTMWARVKGRAENALLAMPFRAVYVFRPANDSAARWHQLQNGKLSRHLWFGRASTERRQARLAEIYFQHGGIGQSAARCGQRWHRKASDRSQRDSKTLRIIVEDNGKSSLIQSTNCNYP